MTYIVEGHRPATLSAVVRPSRRRAGSRGIVRMTVDRPCFPLPCQPDRPRVGENVLLLNHVSHDVANPYRASHAIFVTEGRPGSGRICRRGPAGVRARASCRCAASISDGMMARRDADPAGRGRRRHPQAVRQPGDRDDPRAQCDARLLRREDRKELTMATLAPVVGRGLDRTFVDNVARLDADTAWAAFDAPRPQLGRPRHRRGQDDRHLLQAELPGAAAQSASMSSSSRPARKRAPPAIGPACAASPTRSAATARRWRERSS